MAVLDLSCIGLRMAVLDLSCIGLSMAVFDLCCIGLKMAVLTDRLSVTGPIRTQACHDIFINLTFNCSFLCTWRKDLYLNYRPS